MTERRAKYGNRRIVDLCYGEFASVAEHDRWMDLVALEAADEIRDLRRQQVYVLSDRPRCVFTVDADYLERDGKGNWDRVVEDVKGSGRNPEAVFVRIAWLLQTHPEVERVRLLRRSGRREAPKRGWRSVGGWFVREYGVKTKRAKGAP